MTQGINADTINEYIRGLAKSTGCSKRKERLELLDQIAEKGKELLGDLNSTDKNVCEIIEDIDNAYEEMLKWQEDVSNAEGEVEDSQRSLDDLYEELNSLTQKEANGTLTDAEKDRLKELRAAVAAKEQECAEDTSSLNSLGDGSSFSNVLENDFAMLDEVTADMEGYAEAGEAIKASANKYGKANMNCEKAMDRNERSWWSNGGAALLGGAGLGQINAYGKFDKYLDRMDYTEVGDNSQTFYDANNHEYVAEYDVLEGKGGNQIGGKMRKATAKVYSYGKTITTAANEIAKKPDAVQSKKPVDKSSNS